MKIKVKDMKKAKETFFTLKETGDDPKESVVWVLDGYDRSERKYYAYKFSDVNHGKYISGNKEVFVGFTF